MIDWSRPVQTRDGRAARVLATDCKDREYPVVVAVQDKWKEMVNGYTVTGQLSADAEEPSDWDIVNVPEKRRLKGFVNVYPSGVFDILHRTRGEADYAADEGRIACVEIDQEYEVG